MNGLNFKSINGLTNIYANTIIESTSKGDLQTQINQIASDGTSDLGRIVNLENSRTIDEQNITTNTNNITHLNDKVNLNETKISVLEGEQVATDATIVGIEGQITTINTAITALETDVTALDLSNTELKTKTQHIDPLLTNLTQTTFNQKINLTNGISNSIVLDPLNGGTYFSVPIEIHNNINQTSGNLNLTNILANNINNEINIGSSQTIGKVTINAAEVDINCVNMSVNGLTYSVNAFVTENQYYNQW